MFIITDDNNNIIQLITIGDAPENNSFEIPNDIDENILKNIFSYKYINGEFVFKEESDSEKLEKIKQVKISALSRECSKQITSGVDWNGDHYSLTLDDQTNIGNLTLLASAGNSVPYHADGDGANCRFFTAEEFVQFSGFCQQFKVFHLTYYNQLKGYVNSLTSVDDIISINYGTPLTGEYKERLELMTGGFNYTIPIVEDTTNYDVLLNDIDISSLSFPTVDNTHDESEPEIENVDQPVVPDANQTTEEDTNDVSEVTEG